MEDAMRMKTIRVNYSPVLSPDIPEFVRRAWCDLIIHPVWEISPLDMSEDEKEECLGSAFEMRLDTCLQFMEVQAPEAAAWLRTMHIDDMLEEYPDRTLLIPMECAEEIKPN